MVKLSQFLFVAFQILAKAQLIQAVLSEEILAENVCTLADEDMKINSGSKKTNDSETATELFELCVIYRNLTKSSQASHFVNEAETKVLPKRQASARSTLIESNLIWKILETDFVQEIAESFAVTGVAFVIDNASVSGKNKPIFIYRQVSKLNIASDSHVRSSVLKIVKRFSENNVLVGVFKPSDKTAKELGDSLGNNVIFNFLSSMDVLTKWIQTVS